MALVQGEVVESLHHLQDARRVPKVYDDKVWYTRQATCTLVHPVPQQLLAIDSLQGANAREVGESGGLVDIDANGARRRKLVHHQERLPGHSPCRGKYRLHQAVGLEMAFCETVERRLFDESGLPHVPVNFCRVVALKVGKRDHSRAVVNHLLQRRPHIPVLFA